MKYIILILLALSSIHANDLNTYSTASPSLQEIDEDGISLEELKRADQKKEKDAAKKKEEEKQKRAEQRASDARLAEIVDSFTYGVGAYFWFIGGIEAFVEYEFNKNNSLYLTTACNWNGISSDFETVQKDSSTALTIGLEYRYKYIAVAYEFVGGYSAKDEYVKKKATSAYKVALVYPIKNYEYGLFFRQYNDELIGNGSSFNLGWFGRYKF